MSEFTQFWIAALQIVWINLLLSGDNAVVIAMACRGLRPRERRWGMIIGAGLAGVLLLGFASALTALSALPFLRLLSGCALLWIAVRLVAKPPGEAEESMPADSLWRAVQIIVVADIIMSLDNVLAVAAVARGNYALIGLSIAISVPIVFVGSALISRLLKRFPIIVWAGAALLGFVGGELIAEDTALGPWLQAIPIGAEANIAFGTLGAGIVLLLGRMWRRRAAAGARPTPDGG
jgi:YjbE family integral membrane protein